MREAWISAALVAALALTAAPLAAQQRARPTSALVVACSGTFAKDSNHLKLATAFDSKNVTRSPTSRPVMAAKSRLRYCLAMVQSVGSKCGGPIRLVVAIFI